MVLKDNNEYYITIEDVINNSEFTENELVEVFGEKIDYSLKNISAKVYRIMYGAYNGWEQAQQQLEIKYIINNDETKQQVILDAMVEYVRGAMYTGMDMEAYYGKVDYPIAVKDILYDGGLWIIAEIMADDEYKAV